MALKATEVGKLVVLATSFDMSSEDSLEILIYDSQDTLITTVTDSRISIVASTLVTDLGTLAANEYMQFNTLATDFPLADTYTMCGAYANSAASPNGDIFYGIGTIPVTTKCL